MARSPRDERVTARFAITARPCASRSRPSVRFTKLSSHPLEPSGSLASSRPPDLESVSESAFACAVGGTAVAFPNIEGSTTDRQEDGMPEKQTRERAREDAAEGKAPTTQAGEFVR